MKSMFETVQNPILASIVSKRYMCTIRPMFPDCEYYFTSLFQLDALISGWFFLGWSLASIATMPLMTKIDELSEQEPQEKTPQKNVADFVFKVRGRGGTQKVWKCEEGVPTVAVTQSKS